MKKLLEKIVKLDSLVTMQDDTIYDSPLTGDQSVGSVEATKAIQSDVTALAEENNAKKGGANAEEQTNKK